MEPTTSRNSEPRPAPRWALLRVRILMNGLQSLVFVIHNLVGYLLMLCVMLYNVYLLLAVLLGMMAGYFFFGTQLTILQMKCFGTKKLVICTPECDDTAASSTPPLLDHSSSESDVFICQTRACIQPSHYFPANSQEGTSACHYGAKQCPSKVARAKKVQPQTASHCGNGESEKEDSPGIENAQLLRTERQGCCKKKQEPPPDACCSKPSPSQAEPAPEKGCCKKKTEEEESVDERPALTSLTREDSPQIMCCHNTKSVTTESQEQIIEK